MGISSNQALDVPQMQILVEIHFMARLNELTGMGEEKVEFRMSIDMVDLQEKFTRMGYASVIREKQNGQKGAKR